MDIILKNILRTIFTVFFTLLILGGLIWGFVFVWDKINSEQEDTKSTENEVITEVPNQNETNEPTTNEQNNPPQNNEELITLPFPDQQKTLQPTPTSEIKFSKTAVITPEQEVAIFPQASGTLAELSVGLGESVSAGQTIGRITNSIQLEQAAAGLDAALTSLNIAQQTLNLTQTSNQLTASTFDEQLANASIGIQTAIDQLDQTRVSQFQQQDQTNLQTEIANLQNKLANLKTSSTNEDDTQTNQEIIDLEYEIAQSQKTLEQMGNASQHVQTFYQERQLTNQIITSKNQLEQLRAQLQNQALSGQLQELNAANQINQIKQQIASNQATLKTGTITSTINGIVSQISVKPGQSTNPSQPILTITNPDSNIIEANLTINEIGQLNENTTAIIKTDLGEFPGKILFISPIPNPTTKLVTVKIKVTNPEANSEEDANENFSLPTILTNTFATVNFTTLPIQLEENNNELIGFSVPLNQVRFIQRAAHIAVIENNTVVYKPVTLGKIKNGRAEILSGIEAGTPVIISPKNPLAGAMINANNNG